MDRVVAAQDAGALGRDRLASDTTDVLLAFVDGLGLQGLIYPELLTRRRIETLVDVQLVALGADPRHLVDLTIGPTPVLTTQSEGAGT